MRHLFASYLKLQTLLKDEKGATLIEYSLMLALIAIVVFATVQLLGTNVSALFVAVANLFP